MNEAFYNQLAIEAGRKAMRRQLSNGEAEAAEVSAKVVAHLASTSVEAELEMARNHVRASDDGPVY